MIPARRARRRHGTGGAFPRHRRLPPRRGLGRLPLLVLLHAVALPFPGAAQEGGEPVPLSKADVVRLLTGGTYTQDDVVRLVRRSCLSFRPTVRDRADFRDLGARPAVMEAMEACVRRPPPVQVAAPATPGPPAEVRFWPDTLRLERGGDDVGRVVAAVTDRLGNAVPAAPMLVRAGPSPAGEVVADAVTDEAGQAVLRIPAPPPGDEERLVVWAAGRRVGSLPLRLVDPPALRLAFVEGAGQSAPPGGRLPEPLVLEVTTASGVPVGGRRVLFGAAAGSVFPASGRTDSAGRAEVVVWTASDGSPTRVSARVGSRRAEVTLAAARDVAAAEGAGAAPQPASGPGVETGPVAARLAAVRRDPVDAAAWTGLGRAWAAAGRPLDARLALLRARRLTSGSARDSVDALLSGVYGLPPGVRLSALGGDTFDRDGAAGLRFAEARVRPATFMEMWGRYDRSLPRRVPALVRGSDPLDALWGGVEVEWGPSSRWTTLLEAGRRQYPDVELAQNLYRVEQGIRLPTGLGSVRIHGGGLVGRWFDRDDWMAWARAAVPVSLAVDLTPSVWVGETVGTELAAVGREPAREVRGYLGAVVRPAPGWRVEPSVGLGGVSADREENGGTLWEGELVVSAEVAAGAGLELLLRHQAPPAGDPFTVVAGGLRIGIR